MPKHTVAYLRQCLDKFVLKDKPLDNATSRENDRKRVLCKDNMPSPSGSSSVLSTRLETVRSITEDNEDEGSTTPYIGVKRRSCAAADAPTRSTFSLDLDVSAT